MLRTLGLRQAQAERGERASLGSLSERQGSSDGRRLDVAGPVRACLAERARALEGAGQVRGRQLGRPRGELLEGSLLALRIRPPQAALLILREEDEPRSPDLLALRHAVRSHEVRVAFHVADPLAVLADELRYEAVDGCVHGAGKICTAPRVRQGPRPSLTGAPLYRGGSGTIPSTLTSFGATPACASSSSRRPRASRLSLWTRRPRMSSFLSECSQPVSSVTVTWYPYASSASARTTFVRCEPNSRRCHGWAKSGRSTGDADARDSLSCCATSAWQHGTTATWSAPCRMAAASASSVAVSHACSATSRWKRSGYAADSMLAVSKRIRSNPSFPARSRARAASSGRDSIETISPTSRGLKNSS